MKRRGPGLTVAVLGADGAGKSTVSRRLVEALDAPSVYLYMGVNLEASDVVLPTTRVLLTLKRLLGGRPDMAAGPPGPGGAPERGGTLAGRLARSVRLVVRMATVMSEEWYRHLLVRRHVRAGRVVVLDRHFYFDYHGYDIAHVGHRPLIRRVHGFLLDRVYPRPDLVVVLDAPAEVLFARKGEGTPLLLERRRQEYLRLRHAAARASTVVDATQPVDRVVAEVAAWVRTARVATSPAGAAPPAPAAQR